MNEPPVFRMPEHFSNLEDIRTIEANVCSKMVSHCIFQNLIEIIFIFNQTKNSSCFPQLQIFEFTEPTPPFISIFCQPSGYFNQHYFPTQPTETDQLQNPSFQNQEPNIQQFEIDQFLLNFLTTPVF